MKITIVDTEAPTGVELQDILDAAKPVEDDIEEAKRQFMGVKEVILPKHVADKLDAMGMTQDDLVAMLLKAVGAQQ